MKVGLIDFFNVEIMPNELSLLISFDEKQMLHIHPWPTNSQNEMATGWLDYSIRKNLTNNS